jgi:hypothetical protein
MPKVNVATYYDCGKVLHTAWAESNRRPCGSEAHSATQCMKDNADVCSKLREGDRYLCSYQSLLMEMDRWCGPEQCQPACAAGVNCLRDGMFPFAMMCMGDTAEVALAASVPAAPQKSDARGCAMTGLMTALAVFVGALRA